MSESQSGIAHHYGRDGLYEAIVAALRQAGKDLERLTPDDLAPADEFHTRGHAVTEEMAASLALRGGERVLDVGSGIGGPSRWLAKTFGCRVTGIDLTEEFCRTANALSRLLKLEHLAEYRQGNALELPFPDGGFDVAWSQNVSMNIGDRPRLYGEIRRVLRPGGRYAFADVVERSGEPLRFPVPWATVAGHSFLRTAAATREAIERAGLRVLRWDDTTAQAVDAQLKRAKAMAGPLPPLALHLVMGPDFPAKTANSAWAFETGRVGALQALVERAV